MSGRRYFQSDLRSRLDRSASSDSRTRSDKDHHSRSPLPRSSGRRDDSSGDTGGLNTKLSIKKRLRTDSDSSANSSNSSRTNRRGGSGRHRPQEHDAVVLARRQKQIDYGKNTLSYQQYTAAVPRCERKAHHPRTPCKHYQMSRRRWDMLVKNWKIHVHMWKDPSAMENLRRVDSQNNVSDALAVRDVSNIVTAGGDDRKSPAAEADTVHTLKRRCVEKEAEKEAERVVISHSHASDGTRQEHDEDDAGASSADDDLQTSNYELANFSWADDVEELAKLMD